MSDPSALPATVSPIFGKLTWASVPLHDPVILSAFIGTMIGGLAVFALITRYKLWGTLWRDWFTSIDHKKIGIMYMCWAW